MFAGYTFNIVLFASYLAYLIRRERMTCGRWCGQSADGAAESPQGVDYAIC